MIDPYRILQPLDEAEDAVRHLSDYESADELGRALERTRDALDRALRRLLRADTGAPDALRLAALSPADLPFERLIETLRARELISLELAGVAHETEQALWRARQGGVRAADADAARRAAARLRDEVHALGERPVRDAAHHVAAEGVVEGGVHAVSEVRQPRDRSFGRLGAAIATLVLIGLAVVLVLSLDRAMDSAVTAFDAGRFEVAEERFREVLQDDPANVTALLYLARIYRRDGRYEEAAENLRAALRSDPEDADVRRELGHLLLELEQPQAAAEQYRRAVELEPAESLSWLGLVRALRMAGDPQADEVLRRAPADVRAVLASRP